MLRARERLDMRLELVMQSRIVHIVVPLEVEARPSRQRANFDRVSNFLP